MKKRRKKIPTGLPTKADLKKFFREVDGAILNAVMKKSLKKGETTWL